MAFGMNAEESGFAESSHKTLMTTTQERCSPGHFMEKRALENRLEAEMRADRFGEH